MSIKNADSVCNFSEQLPYMETNEYSDPENCQGSCSNPSPDCSACTNKDYFHCKRHNVSVCLHPGLKCDGHPQCDEAEDEDMEECYETYYRHKIIEPFATKKCYSIQYPQMMTVATVCNGIIECHGALDEPTTCQESNTLKILVTLSFVIFFYLSLNVYYKFFQPQVTIKESSNEFYLSDNLRNDYLKFHGKKNWREAVNCVLLQVKYACLRQERETICLSVYEIEKGIHPSEKEALICINDNMNRVVSDMIMRYNSDIFASKISHLLLF